MRNLKRLLTMVLAIAMMMSLMVVGTGAAFKDQNKIENTDAVNMNVALGIIKGRDTGDFDPAGNVTRAEMAKMICIVLNGGSEPSLGVKATPSFTDIKGHWGESYIEYCAGAGIVSGMGDGTFNPNGNVTGTQAAKMLLVALGYDAAFEGFNGASWSVKIGIAANQKALYDDLGVIDPNAPLNRDDAAQMIWNALNAKEVKYDYSLTTVNGQLQNIQKREDKTETLLADKFKSQETVGQLIQFSYNSTKEEWTYSVKNSDGTVKFTTDADFTNLYGQNVNVVAKMDGTKVSKVYGMYGDDCVVLFSGIVNDMDIKSDTVKFAGTTYDFDSKSKTDTYAYEYTYDKAFASAPKTALADLDGAQLAYNFNAIDSDDDGKVDFVVVYPYNVEEVTYVGSKTLTAGSSYTIEDCDVYTGIKKDDYAKITAKANTATNTANLAKVDKMVDGKITSIKGADYTIDGNVYALAKPISDMNVGATVKDAAVVNGFIWAADASGSTDIEDYAVVIGTDPGTGVNGPQAKLIFTDGTKKVVDTDVNYNGKIANGTAVTFEINSDKEYELTVVNFADKTGTGFDKAIPSGSDIESSGSNSNVKYIGDCNIADDAVIFVYNTADDSYSVVKGSKLLTTNVSGLAVKGAYADENSSNGYNVVKLAYITSTDTLVAADYNYGYAVAKYAQVKNTDGDVVYEYTLWNGTKEVKVQTTDTEKVVVLKGDVVKYTLNSDGYADDVVAYGTSATTAAAEVVAISAYDGTYIQLNGAGNRYEIDKDDTTILYIDNEDYLGVEGGNIQKADKDADGNYIANALVLYTGSDVDLIVFDVNNKIFEEITVVEAAVNAQAAYVAAGGLKTNAKYIAVTTALNADPQVEADIVDATTALNDATTVLKAAAKALADAKTAATAAQSAYVAAGGKTTDAVYTAVKTAVASNVTDDITAATTALTNATNDLVALKNAVTAANTALANSKDAKLLFIAEGGLNTDPLFQAVLTAETALKAALAADPQVTNTIKDATTDLNDAVAALN